MAFQKGGYDGKEVTGGFQGKEVYAASAPSHAYEGKEVASPAFTDDTIHTGPSAYAKTASHPDRDGDAPIPVEHNLEKPATRSKSRGLSRKVLIIIGIAVLILLALALGLGLGLGLRSHNTASSTPTAAAGQTTTVTASTASSSSSSSVLPVADTSCPSTNGTTYTSSGYKFLLLCENDITAAQRSDLGRVYQPSFNACIDSCALIGANQNRSDVSAVYWVSGYDAAATGTCWCIGGTSLAQNSSTYYHAGNNLAWIR